MWEIKSPSWTGAPGMVLCEYHCMGIRVCNWFGNSCTRYVKYVHLCFLSSFFFFFAVSCTIPLGCDPDTNAGMGSFHLFFPTIGGQSDVVLVILLQKNSLKKEWPVLNICYVVDK